MQKPQVGAGYRNKEIELSSYFNSRYSPQVYAKVFGWCIEPAKHKRPENAGNNQHS